MPSDNTASAIQQANAIFEQHAKQCAFLVRHRPGPNAPSSKVGGPASLPAEVAWPNADYSPQHLLAELHLSELPHELLPEEMPNNGVLFFFADLSEYPVFEFGDVIYAEHAATPRSVPPNFRTRLRFEHPPSDKNDNIAEAHVAFVAVPVLDRSQFEGSIQDEVYDALYDVQVQAYYDAIDKAQPSFGNQLIPARDNYIFHFVCGPRDGFDNASSAEGVKLLQLDSDPGFGLQIGDCGAVEYWIDPDDLRDGRFDKCRLDTRSC